MRHNRNSKNTHVYLLTFLQSVLSMTIILLSTCLVLGLLAVLYIKFLMDLNPWISFFAGILIASVLFGVIRTAFIWYLHLTNKSGGDGSRDENNY